MENKNLDIDKLRRLTIGTVDSVSPNEIKVLLETDAPQNTALNTGVPSGFPRINGFILIPNEVGSLVGMITWIGVEHSPYPRRKGFKDFDLIDLPFPLRKMSISPIGTLKQSGKIKAPIYILERGIYNFPSIGDAVVIPTSEQLMSIVENREKNAKIEIGKAPIAGNCPVYINPDKLFGRHLAILGNTGSGKSCSVAGLIRWSLEAAGEIADSNKKPLNCRFIILDPNGEYSKTFDDFTGKVRKFKVQLGDEEKVEQLKVPAWMWNSHEWISFSQAAPGAQRPILLDGLSSLRQGKILGLPVDNKARIFQSNYLRFFQAVLGQLPSPGNWRLASDCGKSLRNFISDTDTILSSMEQDDKVENKEEKKSRLGNAMKAAQQAADRKKYKKNDGGEGFNDFNLGDVQPLVQHLQTSLELYPNDLQEETPITSDTPISFDVNEIGDYLLHLAEQEGGIAQFVNTLSLRIRFLLADTRMRNVVDPKEPITLKKWLEDYIGMNNAENGQIAIIDLSLIPSDVVHIIVSVMSRLVFEGLQRHRRKFGEELPTVLVLEEAHNFVRDQRDEHTNYSRLCQETFERISREGRKFGLSLVLSSQRPSELSSTVLSQCNTFLLHRIVNDRDQDMVRRLVPDNIGGLLRELPILPTRKAILLGWATQIPVLVEMKELKEEHQPKSDDPKFWDVWTGEKERKIDWEIIAKEWQGNIEDNNNTGDQEQSEKDDDLPF